MKRESFFRFSPGHVKRAGTTSVCLLLILLAAPARTLVTAQQQTPSAPTSAEKKGSDTASPDSGTADRYRIGPGDVLEIRVYNRPQLSRADVRVDGLGTIRMPLITDEIQAACRTENELGREIAAQYLTYHRRPHVDVFVKEYNSKPVAVIGAVDKPGQFQLQRRVRLLELLSLAGGPTERAGERVLVARSSSGGSLCEAGADDSTANFSSYNLNDMVKGDEQSNPYVHSGDVITILEAEQVYIVGNVFKPTSVALKEPITVSQAVAMAGGALPDSKSNRVRIIRQVPGSTNRTEIMVDLNAINKQHTTDLALQANDIVDVPASSGKRMLRSLLNAVAPAAAQLPLWVIR